MRFPFDDDTTSLAPSGTDTETGIMTPTHTEFSGDGPAASASVAGEMMTITPRRQQFGFVKSGLFETPPWPGSTYVIRERATGRAITVVGRDGELRLLDWDCGHDKRSHWACEERGGWLGFRNPESKTYSKFVCGLT